MPSLKLMSDAAQNSATAQIPDKAQIPGSFRDLLDLPVATLATVGRSGYPQVSQVWFTFEDGTVRTSVIASRQKYLNAKRHPKATFVFLDPTDPQRYLEVRGDVTVQDDPQLEYLTHMLTKYGLTLDQFGGEKTERKILTVTPVRARTWG